MTEQQDWRLQATLDPHAGGAELLLAQLREGEAEDKGEGNGEGEGEVPAVSSSVVEHDVFVTHNGADLFAYASSQEAMSAARRAIEEVLERDGHDAAIRVSHWDHELDDWHQVDPPLADAALAAEEKSRRSAETPETRTLVCMVGRFVRKSVEETMLSYAAELGIECSFIEHPHLLTTQVAFTVSGPHRKVEEFKQGLEAEGWAAIRSDSAELSPFGGLPGL